MPGPEAELGDEAFNGTTLLYCHEINSAFI